MPVSLLVFSIVLILVVLKFKNNNKNINKDIASLGITSALIFTYFADFIFYLTVINICRLASINGGIKVPRYRL